MPCLRAGASLERGDSYHWGKGRVCVDAAGCWVRRSGVWNDFRVFVRLICCCMGTGMTYAYVLHNGDRVNVIALGTFGCLIWGF